MSGMDMLLINMLKNFMPKESAEKIGGWAIDGTFDRIGELPQTVVEIRRELAVLQLGLAKTFAELQRLASLLESGNGDGLSGNPGRIVGQLTLAKPGADGEPGSGGDASSGTDGGSDREQSAA